MKRFSARKFALLCLLVAIVAGAGFWAMQRPSSLPKSKLPYIGPQLQLNIETPTALQAFDGVKTVLMVKVSDDSTGKHYQIDYPTKLWLRVATTQGTKSWRNDTPFYDDESWISSYHSSVSSVAIKQMPRGKATLGFWGNVPPSPNFLGRKWKVDQSKAKPFDFSLPRAPLVNLQSLTLTEAMASHIAVEAVFGFDGNTISRDTPFQFQVKDSSGDETGWQILVYHHGIRTSQTWKVKFTLDHLNPFTGKGKAIHLIAFTGRISADNRWPLAFVIEPFDYKTAKFGQQLKSKSWPAPLP